MKRSSSSVDRRVLDVLDLLDREWRSDHRVEDLATFVNLGASRLEHLFKAAVQRSIRDFVHTRRLEEAAKLIASTYERVSEIAYFVGFRDISNFNHAFRRRFGMSPREYRSVAHVSKADPTNLQRKPPVENDSHQLIHIAARAGRADIHSTVRNHHELNEE